MIALERTPTVGEMVVTAYPQVPDSSSQPSTFQRDELVPRGTSSEWRGLSPRIRVPCVSGGRMELQSLWLHVALSSGSRPEGLVLSPHIHEPKQLH